MLVWNCDIAGCLIKVKRSKVWKRCVNYFLFIFQSSSLLFLPFLKLLFGWFYWNRIRNASNLVNLVISKTWNMNSILILKLFSSHITIKGDLLFVSQVVWKWVESITDNISMFGFPAQWLDLDHTYIPC